MPANRLRYPAGHLALVAGLLTAVLSAGCATPPVAPSSIAQAPDARAQPVPDGWIPVVRYGRYTLIELVPEASQQDLLLQVIDVSIPPTLPATVGDALRYVLLRSGYALCDADADSRILYALPLPAAHQRLGPLVLRDTLLTLAGSAWDLQIDDAVRCVCFVPRVGAHDTGTLHVDTVPSQAEAAKVATFPLVEPLP